MNGYNRPKSKAWKEARSRTMKGEKNPFRGKPPWNKKPKIVVHCLVCEKEVKIHPYRKDSFKYCSYSCKAKTNSLGENHWNWQGGLSLEPYGIEFNKPLKEQIRERDKYRCQECFRHQSELFKNTKAGWRPYKLFIHHIDYNKKNYNSDNLISLCMNCHIQTNFRRQDWINYFKNKLLTQSKTLEVIDAQ